MIKTITERKRGCGYRKPGGLYLVSSGQGMPCCQLPLPLTVCPCCNNGIKFTRGFQWIQWELLGKVKCLDVADRICLLSKGEGRLGLMWVGGRHYTPETFVEEARKQGISKRIANVPKGIELGKTWIALAHKDACGPKTAGIFYMFLPTEIQYVVRGDETPEFMESLENRGVTPVNVEYND